MPPTPSDRPRRHRSARAKAALTTVLIVAASLTTVGPASADSASTYPDSGAPAVSAGHRSSLTSSSWPRSIVVLGHSGATGQNSDPARPGVDVTANSWATGDNPAVASVYLRILAHSRAVKGHAVNLAEDGATVADLMPQAQKALTVRPLPDLFLIQTIDNDIRCDGTDPQNYTPFATALTLTLQFISSHAPRARIFLVTQPGTVANNAAVAATNADWVSGWQGDGPCDAFDAAGRLNPVHVAGLQDITDHYFAAQAAACHRVARCADDAGAWQRMVVTPADFSDDGNHPSVAGMAKRAAVTWAALRAVGLIPRCR